MPVHKALTDTNDGQALMHEDAFLAYVAPRPVRTTVTKPLGEGDEAAAFDGGGMQTMDSQNPAHCRCKMGLERGRTQLRKSPFSMILTSQTRIDIRLNKPVPKAAFQTQLPSTGEGDFIPRPVAARD